MSRRKKLPKRKLFNPDKIVTTISQNLNRDLSSGLHEYAGGNTLQEFYLEAQKSAYLKKYVSFETNMEGVEEKTFQDFLTTNARMRLVNENFRWPRDIPAHHLHPQELMLKRARALVHWVLGESCWWSEIFDNASHSGGVTIGVPYSDTSLEKKFTWPISTTQDVVPIFLEYLSESELLSDAIKDLNRHQPLAERFEIVKESRATTVPKTNDKLRMIAVEPTLNMFFQQAVMRMMYVRLAKVGLDVESLPLRHQELARRGSITGKLSTIDFSSASDCVSIELLRYLLPPQWFDVLDQLRCPFMKIKGESIELQMISTMGNAGTFPLETLVFWSLGVAAFMHHTRDNPYSLLSLPEERDSVSVFGDDCILPTYVAETFMSLCTSVGFLVNKEKSFFTESSRFRESCGGDFLQGSNVRPLYAKAPTSRSISALEPWLYIQLNGILKKYISYFGPLNYVYDRGALEYIFSLFRKYQLKVKLVPSYFPDDSGLKTQDWTRLRECYDIVFDKVVVSDQGTYSFRYCRFVYRHSNSWHEYSRYVNWLGRPTFSRNSKIRHLSNIRRKGGYVVARGISSCWSL